MNSTSFPAQSLQSELMTSSTAIEELAALISSGIKRRGFHIADSASLDALWNGMGNSPTEKLQRVHSFATEHGWEVAAKNKVTVVLFQPAGRRAILPGMWRLCGVN